MPFAVLEAVKSAKSSAHFRPLLERSVVTQLQFAHSKATKMNSLTFLILSD